MNKEFAIGDMVELNTLLQRSCTEPERYKVGVITRVGAWNIYDVKWNGVDRPIGMRGDEIQEYKNITEGI